MSLTEEDHKLVVLATAARHRAGGAEGAAVRDTDGRTYAGATVELGDPLLSVSALRAALVLAVASGVRTFEAAVVVSEADVVPVDGTRALAALSPHTPVHLVRPS
jgi:cytidine deaminase